MPVRHKAQHAEQEVPFEESMSQLAGIVGQLEEGEIPLEEAVALFERGMDIAKRSQAQLDRIEKRVDELLRVQEDGTPITRPFDSDTM